MDDFRLWVFMLSIIAVGIHCGTDSDSSDDLTPVDTGPCGEHSYLADGACWCEPGYDWCDPDDDSDMDCCISRDPDSGYQPPGSDSCATSGSHSACGWDEFCYSGECNEVFDRRWRLTVISATVGTTTPEGASWDVAGGAPDLFACVHVNDSGPVGCTRQVQDAFSATWHETFEFVLRSGSFLEVDIWDADVSENDLVTYLYIEGSSDLVNFVRDYGQDMTFVLRSDERIRFNLRIDPDF